MLKSLRLALVLGLLLAGAPGCVESLGAPFETTPVNREGENFAEFKDVPYPSHMAFSKSGSFIYQRRGQTAGVVAVSGRMNIDELGAYYDQHLPGHGWTPAAEAQSSALVSTWRKGDRYLTIIARPASMSLNSSLNVELWVQPPLTKEDLGKRVIYKKPTDGSDKESSTSSSSSGGGSIFDIFTGGSKDKGGVSEEDI